MLKQRARQARAHIGDSFFTLLLLFFFDVIVVWVRTLPKSVPGAMRSDGPRSAWSCQIVCWFLLRPCRFDFWLARPMCQSPFFIIRCSSRHPPLRRLLRRHLRQVGYFVVFSCVFKKCLVYVQVGCWSQAMLRKVVFVIWSHEKVACCKSVSMYPKTKFEPSSWPTRGRFDALVSVVRRQLDETTVLEEACTFASSLLDFELLGLKAREHGAHCWEGLQCYAAKFLLRDALARLRLTSCQAEGGLSCRCSTCSMVDPLKGHGCKEDERCDFFHSCRKIELVGFNRQSSGRKRYVSLSSYFWNCWKLLWVSSGQVNFGQVAVAVKTIKNNNKKRKTLRSQVRFPFFFCLKLLKTALGFFWSGEF